jgi:hypothetical protein
MPAGKRETPQRAWKRRNPAPVLDDHLVVIDGDYIGALLRDLERLWLGSRNWALVTYALQVCGTMNVCPQWVATAAAEALRRPEALAEWRKQHDLDLEHLRRSWAVLEGRRMGLTWEQAGEFARDQLYPRLRVSGDALLKSYKLATRLARESPGRVYLTPLDRAWLSARRKGTNHETAVFHDHIRRVRQRKIRRPKYGDVD